MIEQQQQTDHSTQIALIEQERKADRSVLVDILPALKEWVLRHYG